LRKNFSRHSPDIDVLEAPRDGKKTAENLGFFAVFSLQQDCASLIMQ